MGTRALASELPLVGMARQRELDAAVSPEIVGRFRSPEAIEIGRRIADDVGPI